MTFVQINAGVFVPPHGSGGISVVQSLQTIFIDTAIMMSVESKFDSFKSMTK